MLQSHQKDLHEDQDDGTSVGGGDASHCVNKEESNDLEVDGELLEEVPAMDDWSRLKVELDRMIQDARDRVSRGVDIIMTRSEYEEALGYQVGQMPSDEPGLHMVTFLHDEHWLSGICCSGRPLLYNIRDLRPVKLGFFTGY